MTSRLVALVFPGFEMLDLFGPLQMLSYDFESVVTAVEPDTVTSSRGPAIEAVALPEDASIDLLLVPGGIGTRAGVDDAALVGVVDALSARAVRTATVCTGAALLAKTGRLDGRRATSNKRAFDWVRSCGPNVDWQPRARWVEDGAYVTSSGVAAGMDMALRLLADLHGTAHAEAVAKQVEYRWAREADDDPFAVDLP